MDFLWHFLVDFQLHSPMEFHLSAVCSKGLSLVQWICTVFPQRISSGIFKWNFTFVISGVSYVALIPELAHPGVGQAGRGVAVAFVLVANEIGTPDPN